MTPNHTRILFLALFVFDCTFVGCDRGEEPRFCNASYSFDFINVVDADDKPIAIDEITATSKKTGKRFQLDGEGQFHGRKGPFTAFNLILNAGAFTGEEVLHLHAEKDGAVWDREVRYHGDGCKSGPVSADAFSRIVLTRPGDPASAAKVGL